MLETGKEILWSPWQRGAQVQASDALGGGPEARVTGPELRLWPESQASASPSETPTSQHHTPGFKPFPLPVVVCTNFGVPPNRFLSLDSFDGAVTMARQ